MDDENENIDIDEVNNLYSQTEESNRKVRIKYRGLIEDLKDEVPGQTIENLKYEYTDVSNTLTSYPITDVDNCLFIVSSIISSMTGASFDDLTENAKIRRHTKIQTDNDMDLSKQANDAKYGTKEENDFKQELEHK